MSRRTVSTAAAAAAPTTSTGVPTKKNATTVKPRPATMNAAPLPPASAPLPPAPKPLAQKPAIRVSVSAASKPAENKSAAGKQTTPVAPPASTFGAQKPTKPAATAAATTQLKAGKMTLPLPPAPPTPPSPLSAPSAVKTRPPTTGTAKAKGGDRASGPASEKKTEKTKESAAGKRKPQVSAVVAATPAATDNAATMVVATRLSDTKRGWVMRAPAPVIVRIRAQLPKRYGLKITNVKDESGADGEPLVDATIAKKYRDEAIAAMRKVGVAWSPAVVGGDGGDSESEAKPKRSRAKNRKEPDGGDRDAETADEVKKKRRKAPAEVGAEKEREDGVGSSKVADEAGSNSDDEEDDAAENDEDDDDRNELEWVRQMLRLRRPRALKLLKSCGIVPSDATKTRIGEKQRRLKLYLGGVVDAVRANRPLFEAMRVWVQNYVATKSTRKAARKSVAAAE